MGRTTLARFRQSARQRAIRQGTVLTSIALMIAITTDIVGFLSFRLSTLAFLQVFGTVIAIGLFLIYLLSISALPALMLILPTKKLPLEKASKIAVGPVAKNLGNAVHPTAQGRPHRARVAGADGRWLPAARSGV